MALHLPIIIPDAQREHSAPTTGCPCWDWVGSCIAWFARCSGLFCHAYPPHPWCRWITTTHAQVRDNAARQQAKRNQNRADDDTSGGNQPQRWSDYTVQFSFPEPTELPPPLIQLIDVDFQYPGRCGMVWGRAGEVEGGVSARLRRVCGRPLLCYLRLNDLGRWER